MRFRKASALRRTALLLPIICFGPILSCGVGPGYQALRRQTSSTGPQPGFVGAEDGRLLLDGRRFRFVGVNVYSLASFPPGSGKYYCGLAHGDQDVADIMREVAGMGGSVIRFSAYQAFTEGGTDFSRLDFVIAEARRHGLRLILTLENQWADCTRGGYKYADWYRSGYLSPYGGYRLSFVDYVRQIVGRYRDEPVILMWQVMNEAESASRWGLEDAAALLAFAGDVTALIKSLDRRHPLSFGTSGVDPPGSGGVTYSTLAGLPAVDVVEAHDYGSERESWPADIRDALAAAGSAGKPFFIGEVGIQSPPLSRAERAELIMNKLEAAWNADVDGVLVWSYRAGDGTHRDFDAADPLADQIRNFTAAHLRR